MLMYRCFDCLWIESSSCFIMPFFSFNLRYFSTILHKHLFYNMLLPHVVLFFNLIPIFPICIFVSHLFIFYNLSCNSRQFILFLVFYPNGIEMCNASSSKYRANFNAFQKYEVAGYDLLW